MLDWTRDSDCIAWISTIYEPRSIAALCERLVNARPLDRTMSKCLMQDVQQENYKSLRKQLWVKHYEDQK